MVYAIKLSHSVVVDAFRAIADPTAGSAIGDVATWCFNAEVLEEKLRNTLNRFWESNSMIFGDLGSLNWECPSDVEDFYFMLGSLMSNFPRGVWDLLSIIGDMMRRRDKNGVLLLEVVTRCILNVGDVSDHDLVGSGMYAYRFVVGNHCCRTILYIRYGIIALSKVV